jgi:hypothetical protein
VANQSLREFLSSEQGVKETNLRGTGLDPYDGGPIKVRIHLDLTRSFLFGYSQAPQVFRYLLVVAEMPDGHHTGTVIRLPDYNVSTSVSVSLP